jgi:hypothetical protein
MLKMNSCIYIGEKFSKKIEGSHLWFENSREWLEETWKVLEKYKSFKSKSNNKNCTNFCSCHQICKNKIR